MSKFEKIEFDVVVVGAGGSGLRAVMGCASAGLKQHVFPKFFLQEATQ